MSISTLGCCPTTRDLGSAVMVDITCTGHRVWHAAPCCQSALLAAVLRPGTWGVQSWLVLLVQGIWCGMLHHVVNQHSWLLSYDQGPGECSHGALMEEHHRPWLQKGSPAFKALRDIVMSKYLLRNIPYYINFRTTSELENFNQLIPMYFNSHKEKPL
ncbi:hypothetical protein V1264_002438 [Littorina saxatilis]|uniref:Uncharacterized protein n=1 Tax=Littorina saxatilis TaxID=31220 RepID=A0AAN9GS48_9CAEN